MIPFRHHLVSLVAVFLALAVGVVLGGGPLSELGRAEQAAAGTERGDDLAASAGEAFAESAAPAVLRDALGNRGVALVTLPGADPAVVEGLTARIEQGGGRVGAAYSLTEALLQPREKALVDTLGSQLRTQYAEAEVAETAPTYERVGQLLALAVASADPAGEPVDARATSLLDSLTGAGLLGVDQGSDRRLPLVLVVGGEEPRRGATGTTGASGALADDDGGVQADQVAGDAILGGVLTGLARSSAGVVWAGTTASGAEGALRRVREGGELVGVSTVDGVDTSVGQVSTVLALGRSLAGEAGDFGASGADGAVPLG